MTIRRVKAENRDLGGSYLSNERVSSLAVYSAARPFSSEGMGLYSLVFLALILTLFCLFAFCAASFMFLH